MAHFNFSMDDLASPVNLSTAILGNQTNFTPTGDPIALRTSDRASGVVRESLTTWGVSDIMQGGATYKPVAYTYTQFNEALSKDTKTALTQSINGQTAGFGYRKYIAAWDMGQINLEVKQNAGLQVPSDQSGEAQATSVPGTDRPSGALSPVPNDKAAIAIQTAFEQIGKPYIWAAAGPDTFDCSGLTLSCWGKAGVYLDHYTGSQINQTDAVEISQAQPGDLIFYWGKGAGDPSHVGLYIGDGQMIHAPGKGRFVKTESIEYWNTRKAASRVRI